MLSENIKKFRLAINLSQVQFAEKLDVTKQCVSNWENANVQPSVDMLMRIAKYLGVSTDVLLGLDDRKYIEVSDLSQAQIMHIWQIIKDITNKD
ncbi:MAG: helix-turn-helix domain-containing protein [Clostridiales bacterium]|nr:helix-turn-helix domain-containing protein [Clostridiales bacterium]